MRIVFTLAAIWLSWTISAVGDEPLKPMTGDPAATMIEQVDKMPQDQQPPDWQRTKSLMARHAPGVGDPAPDFTLPTLDGKDKVNLSRLNKDRPVVLVFGSFT